MKILKEFFDELNKNNINYCVLRNYQNLPESLGGSDLDILISQKDINKFYLILNEVLKKNNGKIIIKYGKYTPRLCIAGVIEDELYGLQIDVHEGILPYKFIPMFSVDYILNNKSKYNQIYVANNNDAIFLAFLKEILNNKTCKLNYYQEAKKIWLEKKDNYKNILLKIYDIEFINLLNDLMETEYDMKKIKKLALLGRKILLKGVNNKIKLLKVFSEKIYRLKNPPGFTIAFLGVDGSGKSTIINEIKKPLNEAVHNALYYKHMRPNLLPNISELLKKNKKKDKNYLIPHGAKPSGFFGSLLRLTYYSFDYIVGYFVKIYPNMVKKSSIFIFDRYYYDFLIDPQRARISLPKKIICFFEKLIPKPNLVIVLIAEPDVIYNRKKELSLEEIKKQVNNFTILAENKNFIINNTNDSIINVKKKVFQIIINSMSKRYDNDYK